LIRRARLDGQLPEGPDPEILQDHVRCTDPPPPCRSRREYRSYASNLYRAPARRTWTVKIAEADMIQTRGTPGSLPEGFLTPRRGWNACRRGRRRNTSERANWRQCYRHGLSKTSVCTPLDVTRKVLPTVSVGGCAGRAPGIAIMRPCRQPRRRFVSRCDYPTFATVATRALRATSSSAASTIFA
jgi:hypothetical protein